MINVNREAATGAQIHSRIKWIPELRESGGSIVSSPADLCHTLNSFYSDLFAKLEVGPRRVVYGTAPRIL